MSITREQAEEVKKEIKKMVESIFIPSVAGITGDAVVVAIDALVEPEKPQWKVGDGVYNIPWDSIAIVNGNSDDGQIIYARNLSGKSEFCGGSDSYRPLTDKDWTREIGGVKVRVYEDAFGNIKISYPEVTRYLSGGENKDSIKAAREICRLAGLPIMPYSLSNGEFKSPK